VEGETNFRGKKMVSKGKMGRRGENWESRGPKKPDGGGSDMKNGTQLQKTKGIKGDQQSPPPVHALWGTGKEDGGKEQRRGG